MVDLILDLAIVGRFELKFRWLDYILPVMLVYTSEIC